MAISVAATVVIPNLLSQLKITVTANEAVTILSWNQTTGAVTSAYLPDNLVALFQDRLSRYVTPFVAPADLAAQVDALASVVELSELTGTVAQQSTLLGAVLSLEIIALTNNQPAYVYVGIPHSIISPIVPTLNGGGGGGSGAVDVQIFTASGMWTKPAGAVLVEVVCIGGGAGGASGRCGAAGSARFGGGGGGGAGYVFKSIPASMLGATETVTVGAGGVGGAAVGPGAANGIAGGVGTGTLFGAGVGALGGGGGVSGAGTAASGTGGLGGFPTTQPLEFFPIFGVVLGTSTRGGNALTTGGGLFGWSGALMPGGGGAGGSVSAANAAFGGGGGGTGDSSQTAVPASGAAGAAGGAAGGAGGASAIATGGGGGGGGGGSSSSAVNGGNGGAAGVYGGGGGGGGATTSGGAAVTGAGGNGADGICVVYSWS